MKRLLVLVAILSLLLPITGAVASSPRPGDWASLNELYTFLQENNNPEDMVIMADRFGVVSFTGACESLAIGLRDRAEAEGYRLNLMLMDKATYQKHLGIYGPVVNESHMVCLAYVAQEHAYYIIEPASNSVWMAAQSRY
jgi:hypothetical protein